MTPVELLKKYFGYDSFRPLQLEVVEKVMAKKDVVTLMPTGSGKSVCFQIPALAMEGTCLVVSPLIALMKDQVESLRANGVQAAFLNSSMTGTEEVEVIDKCKKGEIKLLYLSPEKILTAMTSFLSQLNLSLIAIDEAHCVSQWGHDFRPEYTRLKSLREKFPDVPIIALTATADKVTRKDIITQLALKDPEIFISSFDRPNLSLEVRAGVSDKDKVKQIISFINKKRGESGIIYCLSRNGTEKLSTQLINAGISCAHYHAGMSSAERSRVQENFINDETPVICATIAFGMGIDKSNVRWVIHYNLPKNIEGYYQEIGRAGRDGLNSDTILYYSLKDIIMLNKFAMDSGQSKLNLEKLKRMQQFSEAGICRRKILLNYFGETVSKDCGNCDVCHNPPQYIDGTIMAQKALSAIARMDEKAGTTMLISVLRGAQSYELLEKGYDKIKTYGAGKDLNYDAWYQYILQLLQLGVIEMAYNENFVLKITSLGKMVLAGKTPVHMVNYKPVEKIKKKASKVYLSKGSSKDKELDLFEEFRQLRKKIAVGANLPPYIIFHDKTLHEMVARMPSSKEEMLEIPGISEIKFEKYGKEFLQYINESSKKKIQVAPSLDDALSIERMKEYVSIMLSKNIAVSQQVLSKILLGSESATINEKNLDLPFYGILQNHKATEIKPYISSFFKMIKEETDESDEFFKAPIYNSFLEKEKENLIIEVNQLPLLRKSSDIDNEFILEQRKVFTRAYDHWSDKEKQMLRETLEKTNDLVFVSNIFQRNPENIKSAIKKIRKEEILFNLSWQ